MGPGHDSPHIPKGNPCGFPHYNPLPKTCRPNTLELHRLALELPTQVGIPTLTVPRQEFGIPTGGCCYPGSSGTGYPGTAVPGCYPSTGYGHTSEFQEFLGIPTLHPGTDNTYRSMTGRAHWYPICASPGYVRFENLTKLRLRLVYALTLDVPVMQLSICGGTQNRTNNLAVEIRVL
eukprot:930320-Rhodomonas_salina.1